MQLFYAPDITPPLHTLSEEESKHCVRVLRLGRGDTLHITDGRGNLFCCEITDDNPKRCAVRVTETRAGWEALPYSLTMAVAPTKNADRFEWFLEKATEVGVGTIIPLETEHCERRVFKPERGERVITAAMKQSLKAYRPTLRPLTPFGEAAAMPFEGRQVHRPLRPGAVARRQSLPPGDAPQGRGGADPDRSRRRFFAEEIAFARANGFEEITLGAQRLRTETAAVAAVVMVSVANG